MITSDPSGIENELRLREFELRASDSVNDDSISCVVSTDAPVLVSGEEEVLQHTAAAVDLSRAPLPLIDIHDTRAGPFGVIENLQLIGGKLRGRVRFGNTLERVKCWPMRRPACCARCRSAIRFSSTTTRARAAS